MSVSLCEREGMCVRESVCERGCVREKGVCVLECVERRYVCEI